MNINRLAKIKELITKLVLVAVAGYLVFWMCNIIVLFLPLFTPITVFIFFLPLACISFWVNKKWVTTSSIINRICLALLIIVCLYSMYASLSFLLFDCVDNTDLYNEEIFTKEKWVAEPMGRTQLVDDLLKKHSLNGMRQSEIIELLGEPTQSDYFSEPNNLVYWLGPERNFLSIDSEWLIIWFNEEGLAQRHEIVTD